MSLIRLHKEGQVLNVRLGFLIVVAALGMVCTASVQALAPLLPVIHGVAVGEVTETSAVVWARTEQAGFMHVRLIGPSGASRWVRVCAEHDFAGKIRLEGLYPATEYKLRSMVQPRTPCACTRSVGPRPFPRSAFPRLSFSGDFCLGRRRRRAERVPGCQKGMPLFNAVAQLDLDVRVLSRIPLRFSKQTLLAKAFRTMAFKTCWFNRPG